MFILRRLLQGISRSFVMGREGEGLRCGQWRGGCERKKLLCNTVANDKAVESNEINEKLSKVDFDCTSQQAICGVKTDGAKEPGGS